MLLCAIEPFVEVMTSATWRLRCRCGYVNADATTSAYLHGRPNVSERANWERAVVWWQTLRA